MSHISTLETLTKFTNKNILKEALGTIGTVLEGTNAFTLAMKDGTIRDLTFMQYGTEWKARADNWGREQEYKALLSKVESKYNYAALQNVLKRMHYNSVQKVSENQVIARRF